MEYQPEDHTIDKHGSDVQLLPYFTSQRILFLLQPLPDGLGHLAGAAAQRYRNG